MFYDGWLIKEARGTSRAKGTTREFQTKPEERENNSIIVIWFHFIRSKIWFRSYREKPTKNIKIKAVKITKRVVASMNAKFII
jgi:hypothetical protein